MPDSMRIQSSQSLQNPKNNRSVHNGEKNGGGFAEALNQAKQVSFSNHAQKRIEDRSIDMNGASMERLLTALDKAEAHGARESLILMDDVAFIVNVPERKVVTTVKVGNRSDGVFTKIDSVVLADK